jgi:hypothetical protein
MIVYLANKTQFREDILSNRIEEIVHDSFKGALGKSVGASELASWKHSLRHMDTVLEDVGIPHDAGVAIEFNIPQTGKRVDFIITGIVADPQKEVEGGFLLNVVIREGASVFKQLAGEDEDLLVGRDALLVLDLGFYVFDRVGCLDFESDGFPGEGFDKNLHGATRQAECQ